MPPTRLAESDMGWSSGTDSHGFRRLLSSLLALSLMGSLWGCDIPTEAPEWDQRWIVPADETTVDVETLLPDGVTVVPGGSAFSVSVDPVSFEETLGNLCTQCQAINGQVAPKPAFESSIQESATFPDDVAEATVQKGELVVLATNGFAFDPVRPAAGVTGTLTMSLYDQSAAGTLLDQIIVDGATESFAVGVTIVKIFEFSGVVRGPLVVVVAVNSPAGDAVTIDVTERLIVDAGVQALEISSAVIDVSGREFTMDDTELDLEGVDETVVDHVMSGALDLEIQNPWSIGATFSVTIQGPNTNISKGFNIPPGATSTARVEFSQSELRSFLGQPNVVLGGHGLVDVGAGQVTLSPGQVLTLESQLDLVIRVGGGGD